MTEEDALSAMADEKGIYPREVVFPARRTNDRNVATSLVPTAALIRSRWCRQ